jgi:2-haloacid dehalogenase
MADAQDTSRFGRDARPVEAVFFDLFGTLVDLAPLVFECDAAAPGRGGDLAARWRMQQLEYSWLRTTMGTFVDFDEVTADALDAAIVELELEIPEEVAETLSSAFERMPIHPSAPGVIARLRASGVRTGILTNGSRRTLALVAARTGLDQLVDHALSVDAAGRFKPDPAVYQLAIDASGVDAARIGFVTANGWDAAGAAGFGFRVAWLRSDATASYPRVGAPPPMIATWESLHHALLGGPDA